LIGEFGKLVISLLLRAGTARHSQESRAVRDTRVKVASLPTKLPASRGGAGNSAARSDRVITERRHIAVGLGNRQKTQSLIRPVTNPAAAFNQREVVMKYKGYELIPHHDIAWADMALVYRMIEDSPEGLMPVEKEPVEG
jgi:hypothetical protein